MAITVPAVGDLITASWGSAVAGVLNDKIGGKARTNVAQTYTTGAATALTNNGSAAWTSVEDSGGFVSATGGTNTPIVVPASSGGLYLVGCTILCNNLATTRGFAEIRLNGAPGTPTGRGVFTGDSLVSYSVPITLSVGDTIGANVFNNIAGTANVGCEVFAYLLSPRL